MLELLAWVVLLCLLFRVLAKLTDIYALIRPDAPAPPSLLMMPRLMLRKGMFTLYGAVFLFLSKDKISKSQLARAPDADDIASRVDSEARPKSPPAAWQQGTPQGKASRQTKARWWRLLAGAGDLHPSRRVHVEPSLQPRLWPLLPSPSREGRALRAVPHPL